MNGLGRFRTCDKSVMSVEVLKSCFGMHISPDPIFDICHYDPNLILLGSNSPPLAANPVK